jgi:hypothetical protein
LTQIFWEDQIKLLIENSVIQQQERGNLDNKLQILDRQIYDLENEIAKKRNKTDLVNEETTNKRAMIDTMIHSGNKLKSELERERSNRSRMQMTLDNMSEKNNETVRADEITQKDRRISIETMRSVYYVNDQNLNKLLLQN